MSVNITLKLFASLADYLPPGSVRNETALTLPAARTVADLIADYNLPAKLVHLVLVNGNFIGAEARADHLLKDGDTLAIWPPIAGG